MLSTEDSIINTLLNVILKMVALLQILYKMLSTEDSIINTLLNVIYTEDDCIATNPSICYLLKTVILTIDMSYNTK